MEVSEAKAFYRLWETIPYRRKRQVLGIFLLLLAGAFAEIATIGAVLPFLQVITNPQNLAQIPLVGGILTHADPHRLLFLTASALVALAALSMTLRLILLWVMEDFTQRLGHDFAKEIFRRSIRQPYSQFVRFHSSEFLGGLEKVSILANSVVLALFQAVSSAVLAFFIITVLFLIDPFVATIATCFLGVLYLLISLLTGRMMLRMSKTGASIMPLRLRLVEDSFGGLRDIILDQSHAMFEQRFEKLDSEWRTITARFNFISHSPRLLVEAAGTLLIVAVALSMSNRPGGVAAALPVLGALAVGAQRLLPLIQSVYVGWSQLSAYTYSINDVVDLLNLQTQPVLTSHNQIVPRVFGDRIEIRDVSFSYNGIAPALEHIQLTIRKGERVGFFGKTGSGKSTLLDLVMGLLEPDSGEILLGDERLDSATIHNWQAQIAHVPQSIFLADDSILANIAFGSELHEVDFGRVREAAQLAGLAAFIERQPEGYTSKVGERGIRLSGGQRQRVGIARALYKRATVLVLDEATSALDTETERKVLRAVTSLDRDLTILMIAHRVSTLAMCDTVVRIDGGRIVDRGTYDEVMARAI